MIEVGKEGGVGIMDDEEKNLTLSMTQFEMILSDLKTKHLAEKRML